MIGFFKRIFGFFRRGCARMEYAAASEKGLVRNENQDSFYVSPDTRLFCVADGMGGGEGGAKASEIVCKAVEEAGGANCDFPLRLRKISEALVLANSEIRAFARRAGYRQMATTVTVLVFDPSSSCAVIGHVGDSRVYRFRNGIVRQLTYDHTLAGELGRRSVANSIMDKMGGCADRLSHILTRAVGIERDVQPEWRKIDVMDSDVYLVCSDGVYDMMDENGMAAAFSAPGGLKGIVDDFSSRIIKAGALDNYTMIVVKAGGKK